MAAFYPPYHSPMGPVWVGLPPERRIRYLINKQFGVILSYLSVATYKCVTSTDFGCVIS